MPEIAPPAKNLRASRPKCCPPIAKLMGGGSDSVVYVKYSGGAPPPKAPSQIGPWGTPKFFVVLCPLSSNVLLHFWKIIFKNLPNLEFYFRYLSSKNYKNFPENCVKFFNLFQNEKWLFLYPNKSRITIWMKIFPNFPIKLQETANFSKETFIFKIFCAFGVENSEIYVPKILTFWSWGPLWGRGLPPKITDYVLLHDLIVTFM